MHGNGWIRLWHQLADQELWLAESFTRGQAWVDLQLMARTLADTTGEPGEVCCSVRYLATRWQWSYDKTHKFLQTLDEKGWIVFTPRPTGIRTTYRTDQRALLRLVNYRSEQNPRTENRTGIPEKSLTIEDDYYPRQAAKASGAEQKKENRIPAEYRDRFPTWQEYIEWRYQ